MIGYYITKLELSVKGIIYSGKKIFPVNLTMVNIFLGDSRPNKNLSFFRLFSFGKGNYFIRNKKYSRHVEHLFKRC